MAPKEGAAAAVEKALSKESCFLGIFPFPTWPVVFCKYFFCLVSILSSLYRAYAARLYPTEQYGMLIHEFDPWFNFRATEYLEAHGWNAFFHWYDYMSWYPIGRPVGTTIYPGLQITAVTLYRALNSFGIHMSLNDVCVMIPAWFGSVATLLMVMLTYELYPSIIAAAIAAMLYSIIPAHTMRSMAGEFDNECIALTAMLLTFYLWVRSLRTSRSWPIGVLAGLAYGYMVAAWGGFTFVLNMVALHAGCCALADWARNTYSPSLLKAYTLFFVVGTAIATRVPPVGMTPFKSLEQLAALVCLILLWGLEASEVQRRRVGCAVLSRETFRIRTRTFSAVVVGMIAVALVVMPTGYFGPLSSRVRALFVAHTRTGNPLVDSVAEHQPSTPEAYWTYLHCCYLGWGVGTVVLAVSILAHYTPAKLFFLVYSVVAYYFSLRMTRLLLLSGPVATGVSSMVVGQLIEVGLRRLFWLPNGDVDGDGGAAAEHKKTDGDTATTTASTGGRKGRRGKASAQAGNGTSVAAQWQKMWGGNNVMWVTLLWILVGGVVTFFTLSGFTEHAIMFSQSAGTPLIVFKASIRGRDGRPQAIIVDDYLESYRWLRGNTAEDARILAWWDYGYQITGIGNRTTLADGNTWNHEHIATIGKMLTSPVEEAHSLVRHMADYVLIWAGHSAEDLMKSPHMARIGNSVYRDICPNDPLCAHFGFYDAEFTRPTPTMRKSLLYNLHASGMGGGVEVDPKLFKEVYTSKYGLVRIYRVMNVSRKSKKWANDPANRICDPPGSWMCRGQYPPAEPIQQMLAKRVDFGQLEDFNRKKADDEYYRAYMARSRQQA